jgi:hypothetical protein
MKRNAITEGTACTLLQVLRGSYVTNDDGTYN